MIFIRKEVPEYFCSGINRLASVPLTIKYTHLGALSTVLSQNLWRILQAKARVCEKLIRIL